MANFSYGLYKYSYFKMQEFVYTYLWMYKIIIIYLETFFKKLYIYKINLGEKSFNIKFQNAPFHTQQSYKSKSYPTPVRDHKNKTLKRYQPWYKQKL